MAGHMGNRRATIQHLEVVEVMLDKNLIFIKGALPGPNQTLLEIRQTVKRMKVKVIHHDEHKKEKAKKDAPKAAAKPAAKPAAK